MNKLEKSIKEQNFLGTNQTENAEFWRLHARFSGARRALGPKSHAQLHIRHTTPVRISGTIATLCFSYPDPAWLRVASVGPQCVYILHIHM